MPLGCYLVGLPIPICDVGGLSFLDAPDIDDAAPLCTSLQGVQLEIMQLFPVGELPRPRKFAQE